MALKPTWEVKDDGGMGVGAHVSLEKNGRPWHTETELGRAGPRLKDSQRPVLKTTEVGKLERTGDGCPKKEGMVSR